MEVFVRNTAARLPWRMLKMKTYTATQFVSLRYASSTQKGKAAELRHRVDPNGPLRKHLNMIVHSGDKNPHRYGDNPYADPSNSYDLSAQVAILIAEIKAK